MINFTRPALIAKLFHNNHLPHDAQLTAMSREQDSSFIKNPHTRLKIAWGAIIMIGIGLFIASQYWG